MKAAGSLLWAMVVLSACTSGCGPRRPSVPARMPASIDELSDAEVRERLAFIEERLEAHRTWAWRWYYGFTTLFAAGAVAQGIRAGLADSDSKEADRIIGAVKAAAGTTQLLLRPLQLKNGADDVTALPGDTPEDRKRQLAVAEEQLRINAEQAKARYYGFGRASLLTHGLLIATNTAGALIVWLAFDDPSRGWRSAGIGIAVGEARIWSQPWQPVDDLEDYRRSFTAAVSEPRLSWRIVPTVGGAAFQAEF